MDSIRQVHEALAARSETASLDELQSRGRRRVRVIRAEHVAAMIDEAVQRTIQSSGLIPQSESARLVEESRKQFSEVMAERRREHEEAVRLRVDLEAAQKRLIEVEKELEVARARVAWLEQGSTGAAAAPAGTGDAAGEAGDKLAQALERMADSMQQRLDQLGRKMGISSAVEADSVRLDALFKNIDAAELESNMEGMEVRTKTGSGIAGNLARLKKLKGGDG